MTWNITDRFPNWGETGESPADGFFYEGGDQVNEKHLDYLWNSVKGLEDDVQASLNDIDSDSDGVVDAADTSQKVKGNDIDSNGDGVVDEADTTTNFDEDAQDAVAAILQGGSNVNVTYDDAGDALTVDTSALNTEQVEDAVSSLVAADSNLSWSYDDPNDALTISLSNSISVDTIEASGTITDPNGTSHSSELADKADIVDNHANLNNVQPSQHHQKGATAAEKRLIAHSISGDY